MKKYAQERELEDLLIDGISGGAVGGKLDQKARVFEVVLDSFYVGMIAPNFQVDFVAGRDIRKMDIGDIVNVLQSWCLAQVLKYILVQRLHHSYDHSHLGATTVKLCLIQLKSK